MGHKSPPLTRARVASRSTFRLARWADDEHNVRRIRRYVQRLQRADRDHVGMRCVRFKRRWRMRAAHATGGTV